jgi:ATP-binding cassette subfamily C protein
MSRRAVVSPNTAIGKALAECRQAFLSVAVFSAVVNLLMLAGPLYMLQVYDRVLASRSAPTLVALSVFVVGAYGFQAVLDLIRSRIVVRAAAVLDQQLGGDVHRAVVRLSTETRGPGEAMQPVRDLDQIRSFLTGAGPLAIVDLPWVPVFIIVCWLIHPWIGMVALAGAIVLFGLATLTERAGRSPVRAAAREGTLRLAMIDATCRNGETVAAMGMADSLAGRWSVSSQRFVAASQAAADVIGTHGTVSRVFRLLLQSAILGFGAYLVIHQELMAGAMIAAAIMMGRALAPVETAIANWRGFIAARDSIARLDSTLAKGDADRTTTALPRPASSLSVEHMTLIPPGAAKPVLAGINFSLSAGEALGVIGPSGSGKTCLARALVGIWHAARGTIRIDGAALSHWRREALGPCIGYLGQTIELFDGTVAANIARMEPRPDDAAVLRAAEAADAGEMILRLPAGYDTPIGEGGALLSAGQRQRVALARALYGDPFLIVLDEPNANLDNDGDIALEKAVRAAKARGAIVVVVAHRPSGLAACDKVLVLANGIQRDFGPRDEVLRRVLVRPAPGAGLRVVGETSGGGG